MTSPGTQIILLISNHLRVGDIAYSWCRTALDKPGGAALCLHDFYHEHRVKAAPRIRAIEDILRQRRSTDDEH